jgi:hypothetical protein
MALTTDAQFRQWIKQLLLVYPEGGTIQLLETHRGVGHLMHGWYMRVHRGVQATLALQAKGLDDVAAPIRRSTVEHTIALAWLERVGDAISPTIGSGNRHHAEKMRRALEKVAWDQVERAVIDEILAEPQPSREERSGDRYLQFTACAVEHGHPMDVAAWQIETSRCHPRWSSASEYWVWGYDRAIRHPLWSISQPAAVGPYLFRALLSVNAMLEGHPWTAELDEANLRLADIMEHVVEPEGMTLPEGSSVSVG